MRVPIGRLASWPARSQGSTECTQCARHPVHDSFRDQQAASGPHITLGDGVQVTHSEPRAVTHARARVPADGACPACSAAAPSWLGENSLQGGDAGHKFAVSGPAARSWSRVLVSHERRRRTRYCRPTVRASLMRGGCDRRSARRAGRARLGWRSGRAPAGRRRLTCSTPSSPRTASRPSPAATADQRVTESQRPHPVNDTARSSGRELPVLAPVRAQVLLKELSQARRRWIPVVPVV